MPFSDNKSFKKNPRLITDAKGVYLTNHEGKKMIDGSSGLFCNPLGHGRREITEAVTKQLDKSSLNTKIMIDFSHANSSKKFENQMLVCDDVCQQIIGGNDNIFGVMVESHLVEGNQSLVNGKAEVYGQSITDACIGWEDTEKALYMLSEAIEKRKSNASSYNP